MTPDSHQHTKQVLEDAYQATFRAQNWIIAGCGGCTHGLASHNPGRGRRRGSCSAVEGPDATPCPCTGYRHLLDPDLEP